MFETEAGYLHAGLEQLKPYLLSDEVYWNLGLRAPRGLAPYPQLTLGNLLLAEAKAKGAAQSEEERARIKDLSEQLEAQRDEWRSAWEAKAEQEFGVRLRQWGRILTEIGEEPGRHKASYASEVRDRAELDLLKDDLPGGLHAELAVWDARLKRLTQAGDFVWEPEVKGSFPKEDYWYLWVKLKQ
ncbi:MAG: hypothetical protein DWG76_00595 [Chloroflexi bacterium]|nr:hypothetical protein [Chloroflexota bacterium]